MLIVNLSNHPQVIAIEINDELPTQKFAKLYMRDLQALSAFRSAHCRFNIFGAFEPHKIQNLHITEQGTELTFVFIYHMGELHTKRDIYKEQREIMKIANILNLLID